MVSERSVGNLMLVVLASALLAGSLMTTWWSYEHSTGRQTPAGGFHDPEDDGVVITSWDAGPLQSRGTAEPADEQATTQILSWTAWFIYGTFALLAASALSELPGVSRLLVRRVTLTLNLLAFAAIGAALVLVWFLLPDAFGHGVTKPYSSFLDESGYTMTRLRLGWPLAALALPSIFGGFLLKFQAGAPDPTVVAELYAKGEI